MNMLPEKQQKEHLSYLQTRISRHKVLKFSVSGEERIEIKLDQSYGPSTGYNIPTIPPSATSTYKESNIFYYKDLSQFLKSIGTKIEVKEDNDNNNNTTLEVDGGIWKIPFEFAIPDDALESYEGKCAKIIYSIKTAANGTWRRDIDAYLPFIVFSQKRVRYINFDRAIREEIQERRISEEINEKRNASIRLDLEEQKNTFSPGETIRGTLSLESAKALKIRKIELILQAIEFAQAKGKKKRSKVSPDYKEKFELNKGDDSNSVIPFEIHIPKEIRRSYLGKLSEYYWLLEAKADIRWSDDLYDRTIIQIV